MWFDVEVPVAGYVTVEVEANSPKEAIEKAMEKEFPVEGLNEITDLEKYEKLVEGNVFYAPCSEARASEKDGPGE